MGDAESESILNELLSSSLDETDGSVDIGSPREGNGFHGKPRRSSILSRSNSSRPRVKKSVSFCSMPQDRRVSNGKTFSLQLSMEVQLLLIIAKQSNLREKTSISGITSISSITRMFTVFTIQYNLHLLFRKTSTLSCQTKHCIFSVLIYYFAYHHHHASSSSIFLQFFSDYWQFTV